MHIHLIIYIYICYINFANHVKSSIINMSFNEVTQSLGCFFERQPCHDDRIIEISHGLKKERQQVQPLVVHTSTSSELFMLGWALKPDNFLVARWCKFQLVGMAHPQNL